VAGLLAAPTDARAGRTPRSYDDPFAYCAAVGTIDAPDRGYAGSPVPDAIALALKKEFGAPQDAPLETFVRGTSWRCFRGQVLACNVGANLPCQEHADVSRSPSRGMRAFCHDSPGAEVIPHFAAGTSVFEWRCAGKTPQIVRQVGKADPRGFVAGIWHRIPPPR
jgi:hypothetical protein